MRTSLVFTLAAALIVTATASYTPAAAAPAAAVLGACDRTAGCNYSANPNTGDITGCSKQSGVCFYCAADGKKECIQVRTANPKTGRFQSITGGNLIDMLSASPAQ